MAVAGSSVSPKLSALPAPEPSKKRLKAAPSWLEGAATLHALFVAALPDKERHVDEWLVALADPSIGITSLEDVRRLDHEDIPSLPVPPLAKSVLRKVLDREVAQMSQQQSILEATLQRREDFLAPLRDRNMQHAMAGSKYFQDNNHFRLIATREELEVGVRIVARRIESWCKGERIVLVGILKGAFMFMSDLCRALVRPYSVYFVEASSYKAGRKQCAMEILSAVDPSKFRDSTTQTPHKVVIVDELLDNGKTMQDMKQYFLDALAATHQEKDILTVCLMSKHRARTCPEADITGIPALPDLWLVGYGLDDRGTKRGWTDLFAMPKVQIVETVDEEAVNTLLESCDEKAFMTKPLIFAGVELAYHDMKRYRICGLDTAVIHSLTTKTTSGSKTSGVGGVVLAKAELKQRLAHLPVLKGKYEHQLRFAFIREGEDLVPEDAIFSGDLQVYAKMRCALRRRILVAARRFGVPAGDLEDVIDLSPQPCP